MKKVWRKRKVATEAKLGLYNGIVVPSVLYGSETWEVNAGFGEKVDVFEMNCLRPIREFTMLVRKRNEDIRMRCDLRCKLNERVIQPVMGS